MSLEAEERKRRIREALAAARADTEGVPPASVPDWAREDPTVGDYEQRPTGRGLTSEPTQFEEAPVTPNPRGTFAERRAYADERVAETEDEMRADELYEAEQARIRAEEDAEVARETAEPDIVAGRSTPAGYATVKGGDLPKPVTTEEDREEFIGSMMAPPVDTEGLDRGLERTAEEVTGDLEPLTERGELEPGTGLGDHEASESPEYEATEPPSEEAAEGEEPHRSLDIDWGDMPALLASAEDTSSQDQGDALGDMTGRAGTIDNSRWMSEPGEEQSQLDDLGREAIAALGADHEASEGPAYEATEPASEEAGEPWEQGSGRGDRPEWAATEFATDEDPAFPGVLREEGMPDSQGPGGWADENDPEFPGSMADAEPGGMDLADPRGMTGKTPDPGDPLARLDAGLPSEGDIEGARTGDIVRRILHALGSGFARASGGTPTPFRSNADELAEERREGIRGRLDTKADFADTRARTDSAERIAEGENAVDMARDASTTDRARLRAETAAEANEVRRMDAETRRGVVEREADMERRMRDPASEDSAMARERLRALGEGLPPALREVLADELASDQWSAYDVERMEENGDQWWRGLLGRGATRAGGSGGGSGGAYTLDGETNTPLERLVEARGLNPDGMAPEEYIASVGARNARSAANTASRVAGTADATADRRANVEFVEGVNLGLPWSNPAEARAARRDWDILRRSMRNLGEIESIFAEAGSIEPATWPATRRRIEQLITPMLGWVAENQNTGIIQPSEMARILRVIPGPDAGVTSLGEWRSAVEGLRGDMLANTRMWLSDRAAGDDDIARAMTGLRTGRDLRRSGSGDVETPADVADEMGRGGDMVEARLPDGRHLRMPRARFEAHRERLGLEEVSP